MIRLNRLCYEGSGFGKCRGYSRGEASGSSYDTRIGSPIEGTCTFTSRWELFYLKEETASADSICEFDSWPKQNADENGITSEVIDFVLQYLDCTGEYDMDILDLDNHDY